MTKRIIGTDIGTGTIVSCELAEDSVDGNVAFRKVRDCFFKVNPSEFMGGNNASFGEKMLKRSGAHFIKVEGEDTLYVLGDSAYKMAGTMHKDPLRPMAKGVLNPKEPESSAMIGELIKAVCGKAESPDDIVYYCVPANPVDADFDVEYHTETIRDIFKELGYKNINVMNEALAVIYSELSEDQFTGISISFGSGMCNICYAFMGMPVLSFSINKGGDFIDEQSAKSVDENANTMTHHKEKGMSIKNPTNKYEEAIAVYYKQLLKYLVAQIKYLYNSKDKKDLPNLFEPIPLIIAGGTSLVGDFIPVLKEILENEKDFPIPIKEIRHAEEPLFSVAHGLYCAAKEEE